MRTIDGIEEIGRSLRHGSGANEQYELLEEAAQCGTSRPISELGWPTWGYLRRLNADERRQLGVDAQTEAILSWTDGDENDAATGIQLLTSAEADELEAETSRRRPAKNGRKRRGRPLPHASDLPPTEWERAGPAPDGPREAGRNQPKRWKSGKKAKASRTGRRSETAHENRSASVERPARSYREELRQGTQERRRGSESAVRVRTHRGPSCRALYALYRRIVRIRQFLRYGLP